MPRITLPDLGRIGLVTDPFEEDIPPNGWSNVMNARFSEKGASSILGHTLVLDDAPALAITPLWVQYFPADTGPRWVYADNNDVRVYEDGSHTEITRVSGPYNATERWQGAVFNGLGILNSAGDAPQLWAPIDDATKLVDLTNWPASYLCRFIKPFKNFLIAGHIYDGSTSHPFRVMWSHPADPGTVPTSWDVTDATKDAGHFDLGKTSDPVVDGRQLGDLFIVYRENSVYALQITGTSQVFRNYDLEIGGGILWKDCVQPYPKGHVVATQDDLYVHNGIRGQSESTLSQRVRKWIRANRDTDNYKNSFLVTNRPEKEIWYCFPEIGHTYASVAVMWNWESGAVGLRALSEVPFASAGPVVVV
jgi:hypothetical protein